MNNKKWITVVGILLLAGIVTCAIFLKQRNETRQRLQESRDQITDLERRNIELSESLENQKSRLHEEVALSEKKQAALTASKIRMTELENRLIERQVELDAVCTQLQQVNDETMSLQRELTSSEEKLAQLASRCRRIEELRNSLILRIEDMAGEDAKRRTIIAMLKKQVAEGDEKIQILNNTLAAKVKQLITERNGYTAQIKTLKAEGSVLRELIAELEKRHAKALTIQDEKIVALSSALEARGEQLEDLEKDKSILASGLKEANSTITGLRAQLKEIINQVPTLEDRLKQSLQKYQVVQEDLRETRAREAKLEAQQKAIRETYEALVTGLKKELNSKEASIEEYREKLKLTFVDQILFGFSQVRISPVGKAALDKLAGVLSNVPEGRISIAGHADNIPVAEKFQYRFPSNWELSSARAAAVARYLLEQGDLEPSRLEIVGLSWYQPIAGNDTEAGRAKNRRVEIVITPERYMD